MKRLIAIFWALALLATTAQAQWYSKTYTFKPGWNAIWLSGDASHATVGELMASASGVAEVWRWNPNPDQTQFIQSPSAPTVSSEEWTVWKRDGTETKLVRMVGNSAYLINSTATADLSVTIRMKAVAPKATWLLSGGNFIGVPSLNSSYPIKGGPVMRDYFSSMLAGGITGLPTGLKVYQYVGGTLGASNPATVSLTSKVDPDTPYWFNYPTVSDFTGPVSFELPGADGLAFGRTLSTLTVGITNRNISGGSLNFTLEKSSAAPEGQPSVIGGVALTRRTYDSETRRVFESMTSRAV